uniref:ADAM metallopeptidase domain 21 n=1 Tax=Podarcis muralis TaxID=64176 RepID=A0A670IRT2_PODMU
MARGSGGLHKWLVLQLTNPVILLGFLLPTSSFPAPEYTWYEVITPRQLVLFGGKAKKDDLSYILNVSGKDYVIQLKPRKDDFLVKNLPLFTYSSQGRRIESHHYIPVECYHEGHVDGVANSLVVLKTCSGLTGFLSIRDRNYGIEPFHNSSAFQHLLYLINEPKPCMCGMRAPVAKRQAEELRAERGTRRDPRHPKYIELYIVVDEKLFQFEGANETRMAYLILDIVNLMGVHFRVLHTSIVLIGLEIWNTGNPFEVTNDVGLLLNNFNSWRVNGLAKRTKHDTALLLTHQEFEHTLGKSYGNAICRPSYSAGVLSYLQKNPILFSRNLCCNADCTLKPRAQCSSGPCCKNCHFRPSGDLCRIQINECDLPEYCSGKSEWCPNDVYMQDGTPCSKHDSHCYAKQCWTHNYLCARIFGYEARAAPASCFQSRNTVGDKYGNCGRDWTKSTFVKCQPQDVKCGRIQCSNVRDVPSIPHYTVTPTELSGAGAGCWSVAYHGGTDFVDLGMVPDGTPCGPGKLCKNQTCIFRKKAVCDPNKKCSDRGVCNNRNNCHCNNGWAPPNCKFWGSGGSIDGGYPRQNWSTKVVKLAFETVIPLGVLVLAAITFIVPRLWKLPGWFRQFTSSQVGGNLQGSSPDLQGSSPAKEGLNSTDSKDQANEQDSLLAI